MADMKKAVVDFITAYAEERDKEGLIPKIWRKPVVAFGDARHKDFPLLRQVAHKDHVMPWEVLPDAKTVIAYFFPFTEAIGNSNKVKGLSSVEWAKAYEKTNAALGDLAGDLVAFLREKGCKAAFAPEAFQYDETILQSRWSQRHVAYLAGLGTLGHNNMLITEAGTCGRIGTIVTDLDVEHHPVIREEYCLYKADGSCGACVKRCAVGALTADGYDPKICNGLCDENAKVHVGYGCSYILEDAGAEVPGTNTCGKCLVGVPCTYKIPGRGKKI